MRKLRKHTIRKISMLSGKILLDLFDMISGLKYILMMIISEYMEGRKEHITIYFQESSQRAKSGNICSI